jgi:hypothetical protein
MKLQSLLNRVLCAFATACDRLVAPETVVPDSPAVCVQEAERPQADPSAFVVGRQTGRSEWGSGHCGWFVRT